MAGYSAGDAFVRILPDFSGIVTRISAEAQKWGAQAGRDFTDAFNRAARTGNVPIGPSTAQAARQGTSSGGSFAEAFKRRVEASLRSLPDIKIGAATGPADQKIRDLQARLEALRSANIGVDLDAGAALAELRALQSELAAVGAQSADIKVKADFATAAAQLAAFEADLKRLNGTDATIDVRLSGGFAERVKAQIAAALQNLPEAVIGANSTQVDAKLTQIRAELGSLRDLEIGVDIDAGSALSRIAAVQVALTDLRASNPTIDVDVDAARAQAELAAIEAEVTALGADDVKIPVDTSSGISGFQALLAAGILLAPALIPIGAAITAAFAGVAVAVVGVVAAIGVVAFAVVPVVKALAAVSAAHKQAGADAARSAKQQASAAYAIESANRQVAAATEGVAQARENAARSAEDSARRVADAETSAARASADAARGVANAQRQATEGSKQAARAVEDAQTRLADTVEENGQRQQQALDSLATAERSYAREQQQIADDITRAEKSVTDARREAATTAEDAARQVASALKQQQSAERALRDAQAASLKAQNDLNDARETAARRLEDLQAASQQGTLDEKDALLDLKKAQDALAGLGATKSTGDPVRDSITGEPIAVAAPVVSPEDRARAELAVAEAQKRVSDVQRQNKRTTEDLTAAQAKGVEGSDEVVAAQQQVAQTAEHAQLAEADLAQARLDYTRAQRDEISKNTLAQEALNEALARQVELVQSLPDRRAQADQQVRAARENVPNVEDDNAERLTKAKRDVADAQKAQTKAIADGARAIADAQRTQSRAVEDGAKSIADAQRAQGVAAEQSARQVESAQKSLADARRNAAHSIEQANTDISTSTRKADEALAGLSPAGRSFVDFLRNQLGPAFSGFSKTAQQGLLPGVQKGLTALLPVLPKVKGFIGDLAGVLGDLAASAGKALAGPEFAGFFSTLATQLPGIVRLLGSIAGNLTKAFAGLFIGILPLGVSALESFNGLLERFVRWTNGLDKNNGFQSFLQYAKDSLPVVGAFLGNLFQVLGKLIEVAAPFGVLVVDVLSALFDLIGKIPPAVLAGIFVAAGIALVAFAGPVLAVIAGVTLLGIGLTYLVTHFGEVKDYITDKLGPAFSWLNDAIVQPVTTAIVAAFTNVRDFIVSYVGQVIAFVRDNWPLLLAIITGPIGLAVLAISKNWDSIRGFFSDAWTWVKDTFSALWNGATAIITKPISAAASWITDTWYPNVKTNITAAWTWMHDTFSTTWDAVTGVITKPLSSAASWITDTWYENVKTNLGVAWTWVKDTFSKTWDGVAGVLEAPFEALKTFIGAFATKEVEGSGILGGLESAFVKAVAGIGSAFDGLRALFAAPFIFLIDTVINDGLIGAYNKIAGLIPGLSKIDATVDSGFLKPHSRTNPGGYATGGILPGYTPGRDVHRFYSATGGTLDLSGGEAILRPEVTAALGADWVNDVNLAARKGGLGGVSRHLGGFFGGGILGDIAGGAVNTARGIGRAVGGAVGSVKDFALGNLRNAVRAVLGPLLEQLGGFGGGGVVTGMALGVANKLTGGLLGLAGDKDSEVPESGALPAAAGNGIVGKPTNGPYGLGYGNTYANGGYHSGQDFPVPIGTPVAAALDGVVEYVKHLTTSYGNHVAIKHPNGAETLYAHLSSTIADAGQKILGGQLLGYSGSSGNSTGPHLHFEYRTPPGGYSHAINPRDVIGTKVYDHGGYLDPGLQLVYNGTGKPEPVFTDAQFSAMTAANTTTSQRAYHYHAAEGRSMPQDDFLEAGARAEVLFVGW